MCESIRNFFQKAFPVFSQVGYILKSSKFSSLPTNSVVHSPPRGFDSHSAGQKNVSPFMETEGSLPCSKEPAPGPTFP
jgi:hypothetical protein